MTSPFNSSAVRGALKTLIAASLVAAAAHASATDYFVVVPVPGRIAVLDDISVSLSSYSLPSGLVGIAYPTFDFKSLLAVTGDAAYNGSWVSWFIQSGSLPAGLALSSTGLLSGTPTGAVNSAFTVGATYKTKVGAQAYSLNIVQGTPTASLSLGSYAFPSVLGGSMEPTAFKTITLSNTGTANLSITSTAFSGANAAKFAIANKQCGATLAPSASCTFDVQSLNTGAGTYSATLNVTTAELGVKTATVSASTVPFYLHLTPSAGGTTNGTVIVQTNGQPYGPPLTALTPIVGGTLVNAGGSTWAASSISGSSQTMSNYIYYTWRTLTFPTQPPSGTYTLKTVNAAGAVIGQQSVVIP